MRMNLLERRKSVAIAALIAVLCLLLISSSSVPVNSRVSAQSGPGEPTPKKTTPKKTTPTKSTTPTKRTTSTGTGATNTARTTNTTSATAKSSRPNPGAIVRNQMGMEFAYVPAGSFMMGSENGEANEKPVHQVTISNGFYLGQYEVTIGEWRAIMGDIPEGMKYPGSRFKESERQPVVCVSLNDAQEFIYKLNRRGDGFIYRLPSEAEWEYACRAGTMTEFAFGNSLSSKQANFDGNDPFGGAAKGVYRRKTVPVGSYQPNGWGLYDMHGNVKEWCEDIWHDSYNGAPSDGSTWMSGRDSSVRVLRGGAWDGGASLLRSASRNGGVADDPLADGVLIGFRVVAVARSRTTAVAPGVSAQSLRTQDAELNIGTIDNSDKFVDVINWCFFKSPSASERSKSDIFFVDLDETPYKFWLNIDGRVTALKLVSSTLKNYRRQKKGSGYTETYRSGDITARITYVVVKKYPEGTAFTATVVVTKGNRSKTVKVVGECG